MWCGEIDYSGCGWDVDVSVGGCALWEWTGSGEYRGGEREVVSTQGVSAVESGGGGEGCVAEWTDEEGFDESSHGRRGRAAPET